MDNQIKLDQLRWGMIGCGDVTEIKSGPAFNKVPHSSLQAVMSRNADKVADYALRHGVPSYYTDANLLINDPLVNAIYIATPPASHEEYVIQALQSGKPVYVEKPVTTDVAACERLIEAANQYQTKLVVAHYRRELPLFKAIQQILVSGQLGKIRLVRINWLQPFQSKLIATTNENWRVNPAISGAGLFYDIGPHQIDMMLHLFGDALNYRGFAINQGGHYAPEDLVTGFIHFNNNVLFTGTWGFTMPETEQEEKCEIIGEKGSIRFTFYSNEFELTLDGKKAIHSFTFPENIQLPMIEKVVDYFLDKGTNPCTIQDALAGMKIMESFVYNK